jgi:hypothetical protein
VPKLPHPFPGVSPYLALCDIAEDMGWRLQLLLEDGRLELVLVTEEYLVRARERVAGSGRLDEAAEQIAAQVLV